MRLLCFYEKRGLNQSKHMFLFNYEQKILDLPSKWFMIPEWTACLSHVIKQAGAWEV